MTGKAVKKKAEYRSAIRSRKLIKQAFVELIKENNIDNISVKDVVTKADVNRGTFYAHYKNVNDVLEQIGNEIISALFEFLDEFKNTRMIENPLPFLMNIARFLEKDLDFYRLLINSQRSADFVIKWKMLFINKILSDEKKMSAIKNKEQFMVCVNLFASGTVGIYQDWLNHRVKISIEDLNLIISDMIKNGFKQFLPGKK